MQVSSTMTQKPRWNWTTISFFAFTHLVTLIGVPIYIISHGTSAVEWWLFAFFFVATGLSITVGYHRFFAHKTYKASPLVSFFNLFFGAAAFQMSALDWASSHRDHHRYVDTEKDPYNIKEGFWHAHIGWMLYAKYIKDHSNAKDLQRSKLVMHQHQYYPLWAVGAGMIFPTLIGWAFGHALGAFLIAVCARLVAVYQGTFCINSFCHMFGKATYDTDATARDHWALAFLTWGEGYHNFHHHFPNDYRNGVKWYHWDPSKWVIAGLSLLGLAQDLGRTSQFRILSAKIAAENNQAKLYYAVSDKVPAVHPLVSAMKEKYDHLLKLLYQWESHVKNYRLLTKEQAEESQRLIKLASFKLREARSQFREAHREWEDLVRRFTFLKESLAFAS